MSNTIYEFKETENKRWGIYLQNRLLATVGSYEACKSIWQCLSQKLSYRDSLKSAIASRKARDKSSRVNQ